MEKINPFTDDPIIDPIYPATQMTFTIESYGSKLNAIIEIAQGKGPHPIIILLHGFPGNEKNFDLAHIFRRAGFNVLIFYYRGSWGSTGNYSFQNCILDVGTVVQFVKQPDIAAKIRGDLENVILIGHSWGGFCSLFYAAFDKTIQNVVSISGFNIGAFAKQLELDPKIKLSELYKLFFDINPLRGTTGDELIHEMLKNQDKWDLHQIVEKLSSKQVCLIAALQDEVLAKEVHHDPLVDSISSQTDHNLTSLFFSTNHSYSDHRLALARSILSWLIDRN